ncbi:MAG: hypothetical protein P4L85_25710 [Paludisphaera borealis]|uniref:hypothetical protein n=1 Tax=Paludisphaera borealis TaxID=1387353 RepID=UPI002850B088|nr:hypothetical protein [Paludisphaera borealis]MDR3622776.1 hypothetical protein [Paludisphaera borealis]
MRSAILPATGFSLIHANRRSRLILPKLPNLAQLALGLHTEGRLDLKIALRRPASIQARSASEWMFPMARRRFTRWRFELVFGGRSHDFSSAHFHEAWCPDGVMMVCSENNPWDDQGAKWKPAERPSVHFHEVGYPKLGHDDSAKAWSKRRPAGGEAHVLLDELDGFGRAEFAVHAGVFPFDRQGARVAGQADGGSGTD